MTAVTLPEGHVPMASHPGALAARFAACAAEGRAALVGYLTAFDPDRAASLDRLCVACEAGLDVLELGVPFSDPAADGPTIQAAMVRALASGATVAATNVFARTDGVWLLVAHHGSAVVYRMTSDDD